MNFLRGVKRLSTADALIARHPLSGAATARVEADRDEVRAILDGSDARMLVVVGPCSAWPDEAVLAYAERLAALAPRVADVLKLVLRAYIQKPRTTRGWTGPVNQPDPFAPPDVEAGMEYCRRMMVRAVEMGLPIADEALFLHNGRGFAELLTYVAVGARSTEDPEHRIWASGIGAPVGMKNPTSGSIPIGVNGVLAAQSSHVAVFEGCQVETTGNPHAHLVLRGGSAGPNHRREDLRLARRLLVEQGVAAPAVVVDCAHDNCRVGGKKEPLRQAEVLREVLAELDACPDLRSLVRGFMLESFLMEGSQCIERATAATIDRGGLSITDPCLGWEHTESLLLETAAALRARGELARSSA